MFSPILAIASVSLDPLPGKVQGYFRHAGSLGDEGDICEGAGV